MNTKTLALLASTRAPVGLRQAGRYVGPGQRQRRRCQQRPAAPCRAARKIWSPMSATACSSPSTESNLSDDARATLDRQAAWLGKYPQVNVQIAGNCDERGTEEYNLALGERRANAARDYLVAKGVASAPHHHDQLRQGSPDRARRRRAAPGRRTATRSPRSANPQRSESRRLHGRRFVAFERAAVTRSASRMCRCGSAAVLAAMRCAGPARADGQPRGDRAAEPDPRAAAATCRRCSSTAAARPRRRTAARSGGGGGAAATDRAAAGPRAAARGPDARSCAAGSTNWQRAAAAVRRSGQADRRSALQAAERGRRGRAAPPPADPPPPDPARSPRRWAAAAVPPPTGRAAHAGTGPAGRQCRPGPPRLPGGGGGGARGARRPQHAARGGCQFLLAQSLMGQRNYQQAAVVLRRRL